MAADRFLEVRGLGKAYGGERWPRRQAEHWALRNVSFELARGETLGVVGASGSGKSTLARCLALMETPTAGEILFEGRSLAKPSRRETLELRGQVQLIPQQPAASLNPRFTAEEIIAEPLVLLERASGDARAKRVRELMELCGLKVAAARNRALEFSGGERQRLAVARALAADPALLILDESLAGLDLSVQAQVVNLLLGLQPRRGLTYIVVSHDLSVVGNIADRLLVLDGGEAVEQGDAEALLSHPAHARTRELVAAAATLAYGRSA